MDALQELAGSSTASGNDGAPARRRKPRNRRLKIGLLWLAALFLIAVASTAWLGSKASAIQGELNSAAQLVPQLQAQLADGRSQDAASTTERLRAHTASAKDNAADPLWRIASAAPVLGANFSAVSEVARSADDVANLALVPLVKVFSSLEWDSLLPTESGADLEPVRTASPSVSAAAHAVRVSAERLEGIDVTGLLPQVAEPLARAKDQLRGVTGTLDAAADAAQVVPGMMGAETPRNYLLMVQNNAEARASGGIPGALAILTFDKGQLTLGTQSSAGAVGDMEPTLAVPAEQQQIYSGRMGKYMQDVNLTPDFPTAASTAQAMWEKKNGQRVDGVISIDPVALSYLLDATGPVQISEPELMNLASGRLPTELNAQNVVRTLLSDVYASISQPQQQDAYFAGVAHEIFTALSTGKGDAKGLIKAITRGTEEGRVLVWSGVKNEQSVIKKYSVSGSIAGPSVSAAQFGVFFNDGTGAKMDYYVKRTVQLIKECSRDGYEQATVRITSTNTAPADAATSLPAYVTGDGNYGVPPGSVQTNIVAYGPAQAYVETAKLNGASTDFAPYFHENRPVGVLAMKLAPGETSTIEISFGKIVQHTEPNLVVTPTVQDVKDVILATKNAQCG